MNNRCPKCDVLFCIYPKVDDADVCVVCAYKQLQHIRRDWITASQQWNQYRKQIYDLQNQIQTLQRKATSPH